jgi:hypothetical protein
MKTEDEKWFDDKVIATQRWCYEKPAPVSKEMAILVKLK